LEIIGKLIHEGLNPLLACPTLSILLSPGAREVDDSEIASTSAAVREHRNATAHGDVGAALSSMVTLYKWLGATEEEVAVAQKIEKDEAAFPSNVPPVELFCGRRQQMEELLAQPCTSATGAFTVLAGMGGVGKSALAREFCRAARPRYPAGIFWINAESSVSLEAGFRALVVQWPLSMKRLGDGGVKASEIREAVLRWLAQNPCWLLVLDNADDVGAVEPFIPRGSAGHVLLTTQASKRAFVDAKCIPSSTVEVCLDVLQPEEALVMVESARQEAGSALMYDNVVALLGGEGHPELYAAQWLVGRSGVDGLSLALWQAGGYMRQQGISYVTYVKSFRARQLELFVDLAAPVVAPPLSDWEEVEAWLAQRGLMECAGPLRDYGVESLVHLRPLTRDDVCELAVNKRLQGALCRAISEGVQPPANPRQLAEVLNYLVERGISRESASILCGQGPDGCGIRCVDDLRGVSTIRDRVNTCASLPAGDKERVLKLMDDPGAVRTEDTSQARRSVLTTWSLSMERVGAVPGVGPAAVAALQLVSFVAPDDIPIELLGLARGPKALVDFVTQEENHMAGAGAACGVVSSDGDSNARPRERCVALLRLLNSYHLSSLADDPTTFSVHRLLQSVVLGSLPPGSKLDLALEVCMSLSAGMQFTRALFGFCWEQAVWHSHQWVHHGQHIHGDGVLRQLLSNRDSVATAHLHLLQCTAQCLYLLGGHCAALPLAEECLVLSRRLWTHVDGVHSDVVTSLGDLSLVYEALGRLEEALPLAEESLSLARRSLAHAGGVHSDVATALNNLSKVYKSLGRLEEALPLAGESLELQQRLRAGVDGVHSHVAGGLNTLSTVYVSLGRLEEALPLAEESLALQRRLWAHADGVHTDVATGLNNLSTLYKSLGRLDEALPLAEESLALQRRLWAHANGVHSDVARGLNNLSQVYMSLGRLEEALPLAEQSLALQRRLWAGVNGVHTDVAASLHSLAKVHISLGRLEEALPLAEESLALERWLWSHVDGVHCGVARCLNMLSQVYKSLGRLGEALPLAQESLALQRRLWAHADGLHTDVAMGLNNLSGVYSSLGRLQDALSLAEDSLALQRRLWAHVGGVHSDVATGLNNLSTVYASLGRLEEALPLAEESLALQRRLWAGVDGVHSDVAGGLINLSHVYASLGRLQEALPLAVESLALQRRLWAQVDGVHSDVARGLNKLSQVYVSLGRLKEALPLAEEAVRIARIACAGLPRTAHDGLLIAVEENLRGVKERISRTPARGSGAQRQSAAADRLRRKLEARRSGK
jgi:tetratricopeptide (TPR) repeat protein